MGAVTFTRVSPGTLDPETELWTGAASTTISGSAFQKAHQNAQRYQALGLTLATAFTLFFTPDDYELLAHTSEFVQPGDIVEWNGLSCTTAAVDPIAPDGFVIAATIIVSAGPSGAAP